MRAFLIVNPDAGAGNAPALAARARGILASDGVEVVLPQDAGPEGKAPSTPGWGARAEDLIVVAGGDGTLNRVVSALMECPRDQRACLAILPAGTGNALAMDLGVEDPTRALALLSGGHRRSIDVARVEVDGQVTHALSSLAWGAAARINRRAEGLRWLRKARYEVAALIELLSPRLRGDEAVRTGREGSDYVLGVACMTRHTGHAMLIAPDGRLDDGLMDLVEVRRGSRWSLLRVLTQVFDGRHLGSPLVEVTATRSLGLVLRSGSCINVDGEVLRAHRVEARVVPRAVDVLAPQEN